MIGRAAAVAAIVVVLVGVGAILFGGGSSYQVRAIFTNASQIVTGDQVQVAGNAIGSVSDIVLTPNGQAQLTLQINDSTYRPLREGTDATVRQTSLSGIANRYIDLRWARATPRRFPTTASSARPIRRAPSTSTSSSTRSIPPPSRGFRT